LETQLSFTISCSITAIHRTAKLYVDLPGSLSPFIITGDKLRPNILLSTADNILYIIELTLGFEANLKINPSRKKLKHHPFLVDLDKAYGRIEFVNLRTSSLSIFGNSLDSFLQMCNDIGIDKHHLNFIVIKLSTIIIRTTYCVLCMRNKPWSQPELLNY